MSAGARRLAALSPDVLDPAQRRLYDAILTGPRAGSGLADAAGALRGPFDTFLRVPAIGDAVQRLGAELRFAGSLPADLREVAVLTVGAFWSCEFELASHAPIATAAGVDPAAVAALRAGEPPELGGAQRLVHEAVAELLDSHAIGDETYAELVAQLGEDGTVELLVLAGYYAMLAMLMDTFRIS